MLSSVLIVLARIEVSISSSCMERSIDIIKITMPNSERQ